MSGRFVDMDVVESNPFIMYVASATGGMYRTTDNGVTWAPVFEREAVHSIGDVAIYQPDPNIIWVGTGERANRQSVSWGDGIYKTTDGGKTWTNVGLKTSMHIGRIVTHPSNPAIVYVAAQGSVWGPGGDRGLYRTMDGGKTWQRTLHVDDDTGATDVAMDSSDPNVLYAATYQRRRSAFGFNGGGPGSALWKSTDAGATWTKLTGNGLPDGEYGRIGIAVYRKDPRVVIVSIEQGFRYNASTAYIERRGGLYRSNDAGKTWRFMSNWNPRPMYASQPTIDPQDDRRVYMLNAYSFSDNGGETFTSPNTTTHGDDRFVWVNPKDSRHVIKLDDGGIGISFDRGLKFLYVQNLPVSQYYRVAVDNERPYNIYGGLQDNGCWKGPSASWTTQRHPQRALVAAVRRRRLLRRAGSRRTRATCSRPASSSACSATTRARGRARTFAPAIRRARSAIAATGTRGARTCRSRCSATNGTTPTGTRRSRCRRSIPPRSTPAASTCSARAIAASRGKTSAT